MSLSSIRIDTEYRTGENDPVSEFLEPALLNSTKYLRAVGYFRSSIYSLVSEAIIDFFSRGGECRLVCSPELGKEDAEALKNAPSELDKHLSEALLTELQQISKSDKNTKALSLFATLLSFGCIQVKIAYRPGATGIFHEKLGIFVDENENAISFKGSSNETLSAWHPKGNFESFEVFSTLSDANDRRRCERHLHYFGDLWENLVDGVQVTSFPEAVEKEIIRYSTDEYEKKLWRAGIEHRRRSNSWLPGVELFAHQKCAIQNWKKNGCKGIFKHATGSGKTITALAAISEHIRNGRTAVVLVPARLLLNQWKEEVETHIPDAKILAIGGGNTRWERQPLLLASYLKSQTSLGPRIVISTLQTFAMKELYKKLPDNDEIMLVVDECHQAGSEGYRGIFSSKPGKRLGLSATPERFRDPEGTEALFSFFHGIVEPEYTLENALADKRLTPYRYYPTFISLNEDESETWLQLSSEISKHYARYKNQKTSSSMPHFLKQLILKRSRIAKKANAKVHRAADVLAEKFMPGDRWIVYCEDSQQLEDLRSTLTERGLSSTEYRQDMQSDPKSVLDAFSEFDGILLAIRCLDEGVDIPSVDNALILASSQNPRQFIQRRGRVLRRSPNKTMANIYDMVVRLDFEAPDSVGRSFFEAEFRRAYEFAGLAINSDGSQLKLSRVAIEDGIDLYSEDESLDEIENE